MFPRSAAQVVALQKFSALASDNIITGSATTEGLDLGQRARLAGPAAVAAASLDRHQHDQAARERAQKAMACSMAPFEAVIPRVRVVAQLAPGNRPNNIRSWPIPVVGSAKHGKTEGFELFLKASLD